MIVDLGEETHSGCASSVGEVDLYAAGAEGFFEVFDGAVGHGAGDVDVGFADLGAGFDGLFGGGRFAVEGEAALVEAELAGGGRGAGPGAAAAADAGAFAPAAAVTPAEDDPGDQRGGGEDDDPVEEPARSSALLGHHGPPGAPPSTLPGSRRSTKPLASSRQRSASRSS